MLLENIRLALASLATNRMRTFLTMLGIIIGVASIISIMTVSDAMNLSVMNSMGDIGANTITFYIEQKYVEDSEEVASVREIQDKDYFSEERIQALKNRFADQVQDVSLTKSVGDMKIEEKKHFANIHLKGVNNGALKLQNLTLLEGRGFSENDYQRASNVALVSDRYVENMFGGKASAAMGQTLETIVGNRYATFTIIGVYEYRDSAANGGGGSRKNIRTEVYIPLAAAQRILRDNGLYDEFDVVAKNGVDTQSLTTELMDFVNQTYYAENDAYQAYAYSMKAYADQMKQMLGTQKLAFTAVGAISLLVGGIGVMNIMVVSIMERTKEIGTRKALGATNRDIRWQFLTEAVVVCLMGGILGVISGSVFGLAASKLLGYRGHPSISGVILCVLFSVAFGMFFGYYPAGKAAKMNPIDALRSE